MSDVNNNSVSNALDLALEKLAIQEAFQAGVNAYYNCITVNPYSDKLSTVHLHHAWRKGNEETLDIIHKWAWEDAEWEKSLDKYMASEEKAEERGDY